MKRYILIISLLSVSFIAHSNIIINGTRVIYTEDHKDITVQLINTGDSPALVQSWIDDGDLNSTPETANVPFILTPPVTKVDGKKGQQIRIKKIGENLPKDRESIFYLNVLDIPPVPEHLKGKNILQFAIKSRIKVFYRPKGLLHGLDESVKLLKIRTKTKQLTIENPTPYFITIANINDQREKKLLKDSLMVAPFSTEVVSSDSIISRGKHSVVYIDDLGAYKRVNIEIS